MAAAPLALSAERRVEDALRRFWGGLITAAGKPAYKSETIRRISKPKYQRGTIRHTDYIFGVETTREETAEGWIERKKVEVARWEVAIGAAALIVYLEATTAGQAHLANAKGKVGWNYTTPSWWPSQKSQSNAALTILDPFGIGKALGLYP